MSETIGEVLSKLKEKDPDILEKSIGSFSDGYHTFDELYDHRAKLFAVICKDHKDLAWKSKLHYSEKDPMYEGMFIVGIETPLGPATYHYDIDPYWDLFDVQELDRGLYFDGHTPSQAIDRILSVGGILRKPITTNSIDIVFNKNSNKYYRAYETSDKIPGKKEEKDESEDGELESGED